MRLNRLARGLAFLAMVVLTLHGLAWWLITGHLIAEARAKFATERATGARVDHGTISRGGYPLSAEVKVAAPRYAGRIAAPGGAMLPLAAEAQTVTLILSLNAPRILLADIACPCAVSPGGGEAIALEARTLQATLPLRREAVMPSLTGEALRVLLPEGEMTVGLLRARLPEPASARLTAEAFGITLPPPRSRWPLGAEISTLAADIALRGALPPGPSPARSLAAWRDADGALLLESLTLAWGPLTLRGAATMTLDTSLQPRGVATARLSGFAPALDRLTEAGMIARGPASLARFALNAASRPGDAGGERVVEIPLALEAGTLSAARIPIARLPRIAWPDYPR